MTRKFGSGKPVGPGTVMLQCDRVRDDAEIVPTNPLDARNPKLQCDRVRDDAEI